MLKIVFCWELGGGLGHVGRLRPIAKELIRRGHTVFMLCRQLATCHKHMASIGVHVLQAPGIPSPKRKLKTACTFTDVLFNCGFSDVNNLNVAAQSWHNLFELISPEFILFNHSPTAILASLPHPQVPKAVIGTGFICPPKVDTYPNLRSNVSELPWRDEVENVVLGNMNAVAANLNAGSLLSVSQLYANIEREYLLTLSELDHYFDRANANYFRPITDLAGGQIDWPQVQGPKLFVYVKFRKMIPAFVKKLSSLPASIVVHAQDDTNQIRDACARNNVKFESSPLDIQQVCREADLAIHHAGHGGTAEFLVNGIPQFLLPLTLEQRVTAERILAIGTGLAGGVSDLDDCFAKIRGLISDDSFRLNATRIANRYAGKTQDQSIQHIVNDICQVAGASRTH